MLCVVCMYVDMCMCVVMVCMHACGKYVCGM